MSDNFVGEVGVGEVWERFATLPSSTHYDDGTSGLDECWDRVVIKYVRPFMSSTAAFRTFKIYYLSMRGTPDIAAEEWFIRFYRRIA